MTASFFDQAYKTPAWLTEKLLQKKLSRRRLLKSAAGVSAITAIPPVLQAAKSLTLTEAVKQDPWLTLQAVYRHLLPKSDSGPGADDIQATNYLYNVIHLQPTAAQEIAFVYRGVGWLNDYSQSQHQQNFIQLNQSQKEVLLKGISRSRAGENWLSTLVDYLLEAMLTPPVYGGNPDGIGWRWLSHQAGFPLPVEGKRYYELPGQTPQTIKQQSPRKGQKA